MRCWSSAPEYSAPVSRISLAASDRKSTRLNSSHLGTSYAVFCLKKKKKYESPLGSAALYLLGNRQHRVKPDGHPTRHAFREDHRLIVFLSPHNLRLARHLPAIHR